jgi:hypothetical protein
MDTLAVAADERVKTVRFDADSIWVDLMDGRCISAPLAWFPRLAAATGEQLAHWELSAGGHGIHWEELDEDISTEGLLRGARAPR